MGGNKNNSQCKTSCVFLCESMGLAWRAPTKLVNMGTGWVRPTPSPCPLRLETICSERVGAVLPVKSVFAGPVSVIRLWYLFVAFLEVK